MKGGSAGVIESIVKDSPLDPAKIEAELEELSKTMPPKQRPWEPWEDQLLLKFSGKVRDVDLARKLGRTICSVSNRRYNLAGANHE